MKKQIFLILVIVIAGALLGNWIYGNILSKKIERQLELQIEKSIGEGDVSFEKVHVNPLFSKLEFYGLSITTPEGNEIVSSSFVKLGMPYSEAMRLLKANEIDDIKSFNIQFEDLSVYIENADDKLLIDDLEFDFKGRISKKDIEALNEKFPEHKQAINVKAEGLKFAETPWMDALGFTSEQIKRFNQVDDIVMSFKFNPGKKQLDLKKFQMNSPLASYSSKGQINYLGDGFNNVALDEGYSKVELALNDKGVVWGDPEVTGLYKLNNFHAKVEGKVSYNEKVPVIHSQSTDILIEDLSVEYSGEKKKQLESQMAMLGLKMDKLELSRLSLKSSLHDNMIYIQDSEILSSLLNAQVEATIDVDPSSHETAQIKNGSIIISGLAPGIKNALSAYELMTMQSLPRKGEDIVLELSGDITRPTIKGLRY